MKYYPLADDRWEQGPKFAEVLDGLEVGAGRLGVSLKGSKGRVEDVSRQAVVLQNEIEVV